MADITGITTTRETENAVVVQLKLEGIPDESVFFKLEKLMEKYKKAKIPIDADCILSSQEIVARIENLDVATFKYLAEKYEKTPYKNYFDCLSFHLRFTTDKGIAVEIIVRSKKIIVEI